MSRIWGLGLIPGITFKLKPASHKFAGPLTIALSSLGLYGQSFAVPSAVTLSTRAVEPPIAGLSLHRFEAGTVIANMRLSCSMGAKCTAPQLGIGTAAAYNLNQHFAVDSSLLTLTGNDASQASGSVGEGGRGTEFLIGGRAEVRARRYGFFAVDKPGVVNWSHALTGANLTPNGTGGFKLAYQFQSRTYFANEIGGGAEFSPNDRLHVRVEMGDLIVHNNDTLRYNIAGIVMPVCAGACSRWTSNLQTTAGVYFTAGRPIEWNPGRFDDRPEHPFLDRTNVSLLAVGMLAQAADAITTQRFLRHGIVEGNPLAAPFVKYGWSGQIGLAALSNLGEIGGMRALHRMHQHRMERLLPVVVGSASAVMAYRNQQISDRPAQ